MVKEAERSNLHYPLKFPFYLLGRITFFCVYLHSNTEHHMANNEKIEALNRLKVVLVEKGKTSRWLAEQLGKTEHTISRWCQNKTQPSIAQLNEIARVLMIDVRSLINPSQEEHNEQ